MTNRNPYENGVDIPDFVEKNDNDIDMSIFKMPSDDEPRKSIEVDEFDEDPYSEDYGERKLSQRGLVIIGGIIIALLLIATIIGWGFGISRNNKYVELQEQYTEVETKLNSANAEIVTLKEENAKLTEEIAANEATAVETETGTKMTVTVGVTLRTGAGTKYQTVNINKLPDDLKLLVNDNATINVGSSITVYETKTDDSNRTWAKIVSDQDVWMCIQEGDEKYAK